MIHADTLVNLAESENSIRCNNHHSCNQELSTPESLIPPSGSWYFYKIRKPVGQLTCHLSEPPDIKNWFSSYEYESLVLETNDNFGFSEQGSQSYGNECSTVKAAIDNSRGLFTSGKKTDGVTKKKTSTMLVECNHFEEDNKCENQVLDSPDSPLVYVEESEACGIENWFSSYAYKSPALDTMEVLILGDHKESMVHNNGKDVEKEKNLDDLICNQNLEACNNESTKDGKSSSELLLSNDDDGASETLFKNAERSSPAYRNECLEANADLLQSSVGNGFVSIKGKKERGKVGKSMHGDQKRAAASCVGKNRKALGDMTNIDSSHHVTGKWKCPRNRKPDTGPPLKQLRLGLWFHHQ